MNRMIIRWCVLFCLVVTFSLAGSETDVAILVRGPVKSMGFPLLYPNPIEIWTGYYRYMELDVIVSFTREDILIPKEWKSIICEEIKGFSPDEDSFYYKDNDWSLLFQFASHPSGAPPAGVLSVGPPDCTFINKFITRLRYFLRDAPPREPPLMPAILEF